MSDQLEAAARINERVVEVSQNQARRITTLEAKVLELETALLMAKECMSTQQWKQVARAARGEE
jgi:hypothetical protein